MAAVLVEPKLAVDECENYYLIYGSDLKVHEKLLDLYGCRWDEDFKAYMILKGSKPTLDKIKTMVAHANKIPVGSVVIGIRNPLTKLEKDKCKIAYMRLNDGFTKVFTDNWYLYVYDTDVVDGEEIKRTTIEEVVANRQNGAYLEFLTKTGRRFLLLPDNRVVEITSSIGIIPE